MDRRFMFIKNIVPMGLSTCGASLGSWKERVNK